MNVDELGRRAVACPAWEWLPGMRYRDPEWPHEWESGRVRDPHPMAGVSDSAREAQERLLASPSSMLPDLSDPVTVCALLVLVRRAWGDAEAYTRTRPAIPSDEDRWAVFPGDGTAGFYGFGTTEAEALVIALEAAP